MDSEPITESAKAVQEVAKTTGQALDLTKGLTGWIGEVVGRPLAEAVGYYVTDRVQAKRIEAAIYDRARFADLLRKLDGAIDAEQINVRPIPPKVAIPLLEAATMEFDDRLQTLWAHLLATAINADEDPVERQYVSILSELSVADAEALEMCWRESFEIAKAKPWRDGAVTYNPTIDATALGDHVVANLTSLGLLKPGNVDVAIFKPGRGDYGETDFSESSLQVPNEPCFAVLTELGRAFCRAVGMAETGEKPQA